MLREAHPIPNLPPLSRAGEGSHAGGAEPSARDAARGGGVGGAWGDGRAGLDPSSSPFHPAGDVTPSPPSGRS
jgi:hypothetical protein